MCEYINAIGKKCKDTGLRFGYHNHSKEFLKVEDRSFESSREKVLDSLRLSKRYMEQFVI